MNDYFFQHIFIFLSLHIIFSFLILSSSKENNKSTMKICSNVYSSYAKQNGSLRPQ